MWYGKTVMSFIGTIYKALEVKLINNYISRNLSFYIGQSRSDLNDIFRLRYRIYCEEFEYIEKDKFQEKMEMDEYDSHSVHFLIRDKQARLVATTRLILSSSVGFPLEKNFKLYFDPKKIHRNQVAEISRLIVVPEFRKQTLMLLLIRGMFHYVRVNGINYVYSVMDESLTPRLIKMGFPFHQIGNTAPYQGMTTPYILDVNEFIKILKEKNRVLWRYLEGVNPVNTEMSNQHDPSPIQNLIKG